MFRRTVRLGLDRGLTVKTTMGSVTDPWPVLSISRDEMDAALAILDAAIGEAEVEFGDATESTAGGPHRAGVHDSVQSGQSGRRSWAVSSIHRIAYATRIGPRVAVVDSAAGRRWLASRPNDAARTVRSVIGSRCWRVRST